MEPKNDVEQRADRQAKFAYVEIDVSHLSVEDMKWIDSELQRRSKGKFGDNPIRLVSRDTRRSDVFLQGGWTIAGAEIQIAISALSLTFQIAALLLQVMQDHARAQRKELGSLTIGGREIKLSRPLPAETVREVEHVLVGRGIAARRTRPTVRRKIARSDGTVTRTTRRERP